MYFACLLGHRRYAFSEVVPPSSRLRSLSETIAWGWISLFVFCCKHTK